MKGGSPYLPIIRSTSLSRVSKTLWVLRIELWVESEFLLIASLLRATDMQSLSGGRCVARLQVGWADVFDETACCQVID